MEFHISIWFIKMFYFLKGQPGARGERGREGPQGAPVRPWEGLFIIA